MPRKAKPIECPRCRATKYAIVAGSPGYAEDPWHCLICEHRWGWVIPQPIQKPARGSPDTVHARRQSAWRKRKQKGVNHGV